MLVASPAKTAPLGAGLRFVLCALFYVVCCITVVGTGVAQEGDALAQADRDFQRALAIWGNGKSSDAEALLKSALAIRREQLGPNDPKVAQVIERLGALAFNRGNFAEAENQFRQALAIDVGALGEESVPAAFLMGDLGAAFREQGRYGEAEKIVQHSLAIRKKLLPPDDLAIGGSLNNLGRIYLAEHRYAEAKAVLQEALRVYEISLPRDHPSVREDEALLSVAETEVAGPVNFVKVFDILDVGFRDWWFSAFGLLFVVVGVFIALFPNILARLNIAYFDFQPRLGWFRRYFFLGFGLFWTAVAFGSTFSQYQRHKSLAEEDRCRVVEGSVQNFFPMPSGGHALESFSVAGVPFSYSDFVITGGFNNTASHGGPINKDSYVRICYDPAGNVILRLEIRDFKGTPKDYAKLDGFFWPSDDIQRDVKRSPLPSMPWYGNFFFYLYILDFVAIYALFLPYLRTFFRLKTVTLQNCILPSLPRAGVKIKLRNTLIYRDPRSPTLWLRPRGFNFFQVQQTVAALKMDVGTNSLVAYEIRFSSGIPFILIVFFWTAYRFFSTIPDAANTPPPALFLGLFLVVAIIGGSLLVARNRSRMKRLVEETVSELRQQRPGTFGSG
jgi:tetratricopeptide (TPR) repeat protein